VLHLLPATVTSRPLSGPTLDIELVLGHSRDSQGKLVRLFLSHLDELVERVNANRRRQSSGM